ncbi:MAG TPA: hypothetical protein VGX70_18290 [Gemmataceae bacterium]|jgi:hypothetical protein|nr:hypothetical protein [Gemmataceae bacterium]
MKARLTISLAIFASLLLASSLVPADEPKSRPDGSTDLKAKVAKLIKQLDDNDSAKRTQAETELIKLGLDILPLLPEKDEGLSAEQKRRLASVRSTLKAADAQKNIQPRLCTIQDQAIPLSKALEELTKQTEIKVEDGRQNAGDDPKLKLSLNKVTFWEALDAIAREADLQVNLFLKEGTPVLVDGPHRDVPTSYSGIFRLRATRITSDRILDAGDQGHFLTIYVELAWEPRFRPLFLESKPDSFEIQDDKGVALKIQEQGNGRTPLAARMATHIPLRAEAPKRAANKLALFKGSVSVLGPGKMLLFSFDKLSKLEKGKTGPSQTQDGVTVQVRDFDIEGEKNDQRWTVGLMLEYPADSPDFESFEQWLVNNEAHMERLDKSKEIMKHAGYESDVREKKAIVRYYFSEDNMGKPEDWKLVYRTPGQILRLPIQFEFKDLELP